MRRYSICLAIVLLLHGGMLRAGGPHRELPYYPCVEYGLNKISHCGADSVRLNLFYTKLDSLLLFGQGNINIWHVGGSHVQADMLTHRMRLSFNDLREDISGVRGVMFPQNIIKYNGRTNYEFECYGQWETVSNLKRDVTVPMGLTGRAATTQDKEASMLFSLNHGDLFQWTFSKLLILGSADNDEAYPFVAEGDVRYDGVRDSLGYVIDFGEMRDGAWIQLSLPDSTTFTLNGIIPVNDGPGINYWSSGVNGAATQAWLRCSRLSRELDYIKPDMAIFAIGVNDASVKYGDFEKASFKSRYRGIIAQVRRANPDCALVFITNNDIYKYKKPNRNNIIAREAFHELAKEYDGSVWDLFTIMGGLGSITEWRDNGLAARDLIHFSRAGYELVGDMFYDALMTDYMKR